MFSTLKSPSAFTVFHRTAVFSDRAGVKLEIFSIQGAEMRLKCRLHLEIFAVPIYATCKGFFGQTGRLGVPNIAHLMSCGAAKKQRIPVAISPICSVATQ